MRYAKLRSAANGESCINCGARDGTVVLAHRNEGKGMAIKSPDYWALDLCAACHAAYDQGRQMGREERRRFFNDLYPAQVRRWFEKGLLRVG